MSHRQPVEVSNLDRYGFAKLPWSRALTQLTDGTPLRDRAIFLSTCDPDGRPHTTGIGALWLDDYFYFTSGPKTRKSRNLSKNPACSMSVRVRDLDLVLEGVAERVTDPSTMKKVVTQYRKNGWPAEIDGDGYTAPFNAPSAGPPPWHLYQVTIHTVVGVAIAEPFGATRWRFAP